MSAKDGIRGANGVAIAINSKYAVEEVGKPNDHFIFVRIFGNNLPNPIIVGSVYIYNGLTSILSKLSKAIKKLNLKYPNTPILCGGDWNRKEKFLETWICTNNLNSDNIDAQIIKPQNGWPKHLKRCKGIDHFVLFCGRERKLTNSELSQSCFVSHKFESSDHCVLKHARHWNGLNSNNNPSSSNDKSNQKVIDRAKIALKSDLIASSNYWEPLLLEETSDVESFATKVVETSKEIMEKIDLLKKVKGTKGYFTPGYLKQEIQRRQKLYQEYSHCNDVEKAAQLHREYKVVKLEVSKKIYEYS